MAAHRFWDEKSLGVKKKEREETTLLNMAPNSNFILHFAELSPLQTA